MTTTITIYQPIDSRETITKWLKEHCTGTTSIFSLYSVTLARRFEIECELESDAILVALKWK